ncbi:hypothetical protein ACH5RR_030686 [Cinchona calisaya]|uniref:BHLH domain-containing protein n=1 Tax=Cinchona calisaya TaxID=153742 RepID=A0ABD2YYZ7_9GENT
MLADNSPRRIQRGVMEKQRRQQMNNLYSRLASLLPPSQAELPKPALLDYSSTYVKILQKRIRELEAKKEELKSETSTSAKDSTLQAIEVIEKGSIVEVNLVTGLNKGFMLHEVINILEEEGAQILSANYSASTDRVFCTISSQAFSSRIGIETSRVHERLKALCGTGCFSPAVVGN